MKRIPLLQFCGLVEQITFELALRQSLSALCVGQLPASSLQDPIAFGRQSFQSIGANRASSPTHSKVIFFVKAVAASGSSDELQTSDLDLKGRVRARPFRSHTDSRTNPSDDPSTFVAPAASRARWLLLEAEPLW